VEFEAAWIIVFMCWYAYIPCYCAYEWGACYIGGGGEKGNRLDTWKFSVGMRIIGSAKEI
jgi:hypothetical protein